MANALQTLKQAVQDASQTAQDAKQLAQGINQSVQEMKQSLQAAGMLSKDQQGGKATLGVEDLTHDIGADEALTSASVSMTRQWNWNAKALAEVELNRKQLQLQREQFDFAMHQARENLALRAAEDAALIKHMINVDYAKFNNAVSEPISPNTED